MSVACTLGRPAAAQRLHAAALHLSDPRAAGRTSWPLWCSQAASQSSLSQEAVVDLECPPRLTCAGLVPAAGAAGAVEA